jgi:hypothetical protein
MGQGGKWTNAMAKLASSNHFVGFVAPFIRVIGNVFRQTALERSPLGLFDEEIRRNILGRNGPVAQDRQIGAMLWSGAIAAGVGTYMANDGVTGYGPTDPNERRLWLHDHQPYSVNFFGNWVSMQHLGVVGGQLGLIATGFETIHQMQKSVQDKWVSELTQGMMHGLLENNWLRDWSDFFEAAQDAMAGRGNIAERYINNFLVSFTPFGSFINQANQALLDPHLREAKTLAETFEAKTPWSQELHPRRDVWGEPIERRAVVPGLSALWTRPAASDPVDTALRSAGYYPAAVPRTVQGVKLSDQQHDDLSRVSGRLMRMMLDRVVSAPGFSSAPKFAQIELLKGYAERARKLAETQVLMADPEFLKAVVAKERSRLTQ